MYYYLKIAGKLLQLETPDEFEIAENIRHYFTDSADDSMVTARYKVIIDQAIQLTPEKVLHSSPQRFIFENDSLEYRVHFAFGTNIPVAYYCETASDIMEIHILEQAFPNHFFNLTILEMLALEKVLLPEESLILHSSYIIHEDKTILFTAPSGTGKSTQADLWKKYKHAEIINGDRSIMQVTDHGVQSHSLPFCGSSGININKSAPLAGIVMLEQAPENSIQKCPPAIAIRKLYSECSINNWNLEAVEYAFQIIEKIVERIPVYILKCTISEEAVNLVHNELFK